MVDDQSSAMEALLLRVLCQRTLSAELREEVFARLCGYCFRAVPHQVLFDCLSQLPRQRPGLIRDLLPARLVQAGFPDFDLVPFFEPHRLTASRARALLDKLTGRINLAQR